MKARVVNVIIVESGADRTYFTLEGVEIGSFVAGKKTEPVEIPEERGPRSAITTSPPVEQVRRQKEKETEEAMKVENRYGGVSKGKRDD